MPSKSTPIGDSAIGKAIQEVQEKLLRDGWRETTLGEIITLEYGKSIQGYSDNDGHFPVYGTNGKIGNYGEPLCQHPGIIIGRKGAYRGVHYSELPFYVIDTAFFVEVKNEEVDMKFLYNFFFNLDINAMDSGSAIPSTSREEMYAVPIMLPPMLIQRSIADVLTCLDDKIDLLRRQNNTLKTIAQTLFKRWFVEFNFPNEEGEPYRESGGKMVETELGEVPEGWRWGRAGDVIEIFDSQRIPLEKGEREKRKGNYRYFGATKIMDYIDDYLFDGIFLLMAEDGSVIDVHGYPVLQYVWGQFWVSNHAHVLQGRNGYSTEMLYLFFREKKIAEAITGAVQLKINQGNLCRLSLVIPDASVSDAFQNRISPLFTKIKNIHSQEKILTRLRDLLLPKLMSGELLSTYTQ